MGKLASALDSTKLTWTRPVTISGAINPGRPQHRLLLRHWIRARHSLIIRFRLAQIYRLPRRRLLRRLPLRLRLPHVHRLRYPPPEVRLQYIIYGELQTSPIGLIVVLSQTESVVRGGIPPEQRRARPEVQIPVAGGRGALRAARGAQRRARGALGGLLAARGHLRDRVQVALDALEAEILAGGLLRTDGEDGVVAAAAVVSVVVRVGGEATGRRDRSHRQPVTCYSTKHISRARDQLDVHYSVGRDCLRARASFGAGPAREAATVGRPRPIGAREGGDIGKEGVECWCGVLFTVSISWSAIFAMMSCSNWVRNGLSVVVARMGLFAVISVLFGDSNCVETYEVGIFYT